MTPSSKASRTGSRTAIGKWWFTFLSFGLLGLWVAYGAYVLLRADAGWFTSQEWNFPLNTITTVGEWFLGAWILAASNRVQRAVDHQLLQLQDMAIQHQKMLIKLSDLLSELQIRSTSVQDDVQALEAREDRILVILGEENPPPTC